MQIQFTHCQAHGVVSGPVADHDEVGRLDLGDCKRLGHVLGAPLLHPLLHQRLAAASHVDGVSPGTLRIAGFKPNRLAAISRLILKLNASLAYPPGARATPIQHAAMGQHGVLATVWPGSGFQLSLAMDQFLFLFFRQAKTLDAESRNSTA